MRQPTKAFLIAKCEALSTANEGLHNENRRLQQRVAALEQAAIDQVRDVSSIATMREVLARCKKLTEQGVPCKVRQGHIVHSITGAILHSRGELP